MVTPGWLTRSLADVPDGDAWLGAAERIVAAGLRGKRLEDWRLGRWTAKAAVGAWLGVETGRVEILAAPDGAPEAWLDGRRAPLSVSLSHRAGRALAAVAPAPATIGCDLELVEPRSDAFIREWLTADAANLLWTAKEAAAKVRREGLRLDVRRAAVELGRAGSGWRPLAVTWPEGDPTSGWWSEGSGWVMAIAGAPAPGVPRGLEGP
jgi:4'-phosphopantetheinyl transferase